MVNFMDVVVYEIGYFIGFDYMLLEGFFFSRLMMNFFYDNSGFGEVSIFEVDDIVGVSVIYLIVVFLVSSVIVLGCIEDDFVDDVFGVFVVVER